MAKRYYNRLALLAKIDTTYGVDAGPVAASNAILAAGDVVFTPLEADEIERELILPYLGHQGVILDAFRTRIELSVELAGSGAAGTAPAYGPLLRACGMSQTVTATTKVDYLPVSTGFESATLYYNRDGTRHIMLGARGTFQLELAPRAVPRIRYTLVGLQGSILDIALPAVTLTSFIKPLAVNDAATAMTLHGATLPIERFGIDLGNQVEPRMLINETSIQITDRKATGDIVIEATQAATKNWVAIAKAGQTGVFSTVHGLTAGNIIELGAPAVQIKPPREGQTQRILNNVLGLIFTPTSAGNDEFMLTVR